MRKSEEENSERRMSSREEISDCRFKLFALSITLHKINEMDICGYLKLKLFSLRFRVVFFRVGFSSLSFSEISRNCTFSFRVVRRA